MHVHQLMSDPLFFPKSQRQLSEFCSSFPVECDDDNEEGKGRHLTREWKNVNSTTHSKPDMTESTDPLTFNVNTST